jgi:DNA-binding response OmpR family regulator
MRQSPVKDEHSALRTARAQAAIVRTLAAEMQREGCGDDAWPRVLVVEDEEATRVAIVRGLAPEYEVIAASNGREGLKAASETSFDAIVTDIGMPEMDGITMVDRIRRMREPAVVPVIFLTAETTPERVVAGLSLEGTSYLVKPVDLDLLDQELRSALAGSVGSTENGPSGAEPGTRR